jgi:hypothetical protein
VGKQPSLSGSSLSTRCSPTNTAAHINLPASSHLGD